MLAALKDKNIAHKIQHGFRMITGLLILCGLTGLAATGYISKTLSYIVGPAWVSANLIVRWRACVMLVMRWQVPGAVSTLN